MVMVMMTVMMILTTIKAGRERREDKNDEKYNSRRGVGSGHEQAGDDEVESGGGGSEWAGEDMEKKMEETEKVKRNGRMKIKENNIG